MGKVSEVWGESLKKSERNSPFIGICLCLLRVRVCNCFFPLLKCSIFEIRMCSSNDSWDWVAVKSSKRNLEVQKFCLTPLLVCWQLTDHYSSWLQVYCIRYSIKCISLESEFARWKCVRLGVGKNGKKNTNDGTPPMMTQQWNTLVPVGWNQKWWAMMGLMMWVMDGWCREAEKLIVASRWMWWCIATASVDYV